jgi:hypothetical protein
MKSLIQFLFNSFFNYEDDMSFSLRLEKLYEEIQQRKE